MRTSKETHESPPPKSDMSGILALISSSRGINKPQALSDHVGISSIIYTANPAAAIWREARFEGVGHKWLWDQAVATTLAPDHSVPPSGNPLYLSLYRIMRHLVSSCHPVRPTLVSTNPSITRRNIANQGAIILHENSREFNL
jgi:hypothetical protein